MKKNATGRWSEFNPENLIDELGKHFLTPPDEFRPVPWLCFNSQLKKEEVFRSIDMMHQQGIYSFFIFPIYGMEIEYLSDEWFKLVKETVAYCKKQDMTVWIYDDYAWPSGNCGGKLIEKHPEFNKKNLQCSIVEVAPGDKVEQEIYGSLLRCVSLHANTLETISVEAIKDKLLNTVKWTNNTKEIVKFVIIYYSPCKAPGRNWIANKGCLWQKDNGLSNEYVDWTNSQAIDCFIEMIYQRYYEELKPYWENTVKGFMTDEPSFFGLHYNEKLHQEFKKCYAYCIEDNFEHLFLDIDERTFQIRADYYRLAGKMLADNIEKVNNWCTKHDVDLTGHFLGEESPGQEVQSQADSWNIRKSMSIPGMDLLWFDSNYIPPPMAEYYFDDHFYSSSGLALSAKLTSSAASYTKSGRAFAEAYGVSPYWAAPVDHTSQTHWLTAQGINFINDNTLAISHEGFRKRSASGKHFTMPWWDWYQDFVEFTGRCCLMSAVGENSAKIGLLYPVITAQCTYSENFMDATRIDSGIYQKMNYLTQQTADMLTRCRMGWEVVWEEHLRNGKIENACLDVKGRGISALVIPGMYCIDEKSLTALEKFARSGGTIIFIGICPKIIIDGNNCPDEIISHMLKLDNVHIIEFESPDEWFVIKEKAVELLCKHNDSGITLHGTSLENIMTSHRVENNVEIFHFVNMSSCPMEVTADINVSGELLLWHPDDGKQYAIDTTVVKEKTRTRLTFAPYEGYFIVSGGYLNKNINFFPARYFAGGANDFSSYHLPPEKWPMQSGKNFKALSNLWEFSIEKPNTKALIPFVFIKNAEDFSGNELTGDSAEVEWLPTKNNILPFELNPVCNSFFWTKSIFHADYIPDDLALIVDGSDYAEVYCNGKKLENGKNVTCWDYKNIKYSLKESAAVGQNIVVVKVIINNYFNPDIRLNYMENIVEPIVLSGSFGAWSMSVGCVHLNRIPETISTGDWGLQGFSGYSGEAVYRQQIELHQDDGEVWLDLGKVNVGAEVFVNNRFVGRRCWPPYYYRIDKMIKNGVNEFEIKVRNTLNNLFENYDARIGGKCGQAPSGILGPIRLVLK